jgi:CubicO group peptidase (beta-lactamase class C family)
LKHSASATLICGLVLSAPLAAANRQADEVAQSVRAEMARQHIPGLALLVARKGRTVRAEGYGLANVELNVPVKPETLFESGSVGKQFTATAVMMLVEAGKIGLDDPLSRFFPGAPAWWSKSPCANC